MQIPENSPDRSTAVMTFEDAAVDRLRGAPPTPFRPGMTRAQFVAALVRERHGPPKSP